MDWNRILPQPKQKLHVYCARLFTDIIDILLRHRQPFDNLQVLGARIPLNTTTGFNINVMLIQNEIRVEVVGELIGIYRLFSMAQTEALETVQTQLEHNVERASDLCKDLLMHFLHHTEPYFIGSHECSGISEAVKSDFESMRQRYPCLKAALWEDE